MRTLSQKVKYVISSKHRDYLKKIESSFKDNPKLFWSYHKAILNSRGKPSVVSYNGATATSSVEKAELFNLYFSSVFRPQSTTNVNTSFLNIHEQLFAWPLLSELTISVNEVSKCLMELDITKACGPDGIPARLAPSLCMMFNTSLKTACLPKEWKEANVTPVHKRDSKELASNYRPISLLWLVNKTLERCIGSSLHCHMKNVINPLQHGFMQNRSCISQLLSVLHSIRKKTRQQHSNGHPVFGLCQSV